LEGVRVIAFPLVLFVWFIIAFLADGNSWKNLRNTRGKSRTYQTEAVSKEAVETHK
jgi:hypothetical protein